MWLYPRCMLKADSHYPHASVLLWKFTVLYNFLMCNYISSRIVCVSLKYRCVT